MATTGDLDEEISRLSRGELLSEIEIDKLCNMAK